MSNNVNTIYLNPQLYKNMQNMQKASFAFALFSQKNINKILNNINWEAIASMQRQANETVRRLAPIAIRLAEQQRAFISKIPNITIHIPKLKNLDYLEQPTFNQEITPDFQKATQIIDINPEHNLEYDPFSQELKLNDKIIVKPRFDSENQIIIEYLFNNPNRNITLKELEKKALDGYRVKKTLHQVLRDLKIKGDIKQRFFKVNKNTIKYTP